MLKSISNETKVGAVTAVAITILILGYNFMIGKDNPLASTREFFVEYDSVLGIAVSAPVMYNGFKIGQLKSMELIPLTNKVFAKLEIYGDISLPKGSLCKIETSLLGAPNIRLIAGSSKTMAKDGDTLLPAYSTNIMNSVSQRIDPIAFKLDSVLTSVNNLLARESLKQSFDKIPLVLGALETSVNTIKTTISNFDPTMKNINAFSNDLGKMSSSLQKTLLSLEGVAKDVNDVDIAKITQSLNATIVSLNEFAGKLNDSKGSLGKLANDAELYNNLNAATGNLNKLVLDIRNYPEKYVPLPWGKKQRKKAKDGSTTYFENYEDSATKKP